LKTTFREREMDNVLTKLRKSVENQNKKLKKMRESSREQWERRSKAFTKDLSSSNRLSSSPLQHSSKKKNEFYSPSINTKEFSSRMIQSNPTSSIFNHIPAE
jgi:hypothetical protein